MTCYMLRHKFRDEFYDRSSRGSAYMKVRTGKLFRNKWRAELALRNTKLLNLQLVKVTMEITSV